MEDYNDNEQLEVVKRWFKENGPWIAGGIVIGVIGLFGYNRWQHHKLVTAHEASQQYEQLQAAITGQQHDRAVQMLADINKEHKGSPYVDQGELALARVEVERNELDAAAKRLTEVAKHSKDEQLRQVARVRLVRVLLAQNKADDALKAISEAPKDEAFKARYEELRGDALLAKGDKTGALAAYQAALLAGGVDGQRAQGGGVIDGAMIELKINDLSSPAPAAPAANNASATPSGENQS